MRGMLDLAAVVLLVSAFAGCSEPSSTLQPDDQLAPTDAQLRPEEYVQTPAGLYHRSCVHEIENGARVGPGGVVTRTNGTSYRLPMCQYPAFGKGRPGDFPPANNGWMEFAFEKLTIPYRRLEADWTVPAKPTAFYLPGRVYYTFPGLQSNAFIIQPVLQYGFNGIFGGQIWTLASWHCDNGPGCTHSFPIQTAAGHALHGTIAATSCANGQCTWTITTRDVTSDTSAVLTVTDTDLYKFATGGAVEVYNLTACSQYPANGVVFYGIHLFDLYGEFTPSWTDSIQTNPSPSCGFNVTSTYSSVFLYHNPTP